MFHDPHEALGLAPDASEAEVRRRYLELVRQFPPDQAGERFAAIHAAYEAVRDPERSLHERIFRFESPVNSLEAIEDDLRRRLKNARLPVAQLLELADAP